MPSYNVIGNTIELYFDEKPSAEIRQKMKDLGIWWNPEKRCWSRGYNEERLALAKQLCGETSTPEHAASTETYGLRLKIRDLVRGDSKDQQAWLTQLKKFVNTRLTEDNASHSNEAVSQVQEYVWLDCFRFIQKSLGSLSQAQQEFELFFEYLMPGRVYERPDVLLLTKNKVIILEFKKKHAPQMDDHRDDVAQLIGYREWTEHHHQVTRQKGMTVHSYLVCTPDDAKSGTFRSVEVLNHDHFCNTLQHELAGESKCDFWEEWVHSPKTEMPDMLKAIEYLYKEHRIPYISDVNKVCLDKVNRYIRAARRKQKKLLILISGVPGAGKTAVGQSLVFEQNKAGVAEAVYLSGNGPLVEVLQGEINDAAHSKFAGENVIQGMKEFKQAYFDYSAAQPNTAVPQQSILVFDEAQRAWDTKKMNRGYSEPEGLLRVGEKIFASRGYAVVIGLYGNGQFIYDGEEKGMSIWEQALLSHPDWIVALPENLSEPMHDFPAKVVDQDLFLPVSLRADFVDCSPWVEAVVSRGNPEEGRKKAELEKLQNTSMQIFVTRAFHRIRQHAMHLQRIHPDWNYGLLISNFAEASLLKARTAGWELGWGRDNNTVQNREYFTWFKGSCKKLEKACSVYGNQGLELDCPIVIFGGDYIRSNGNWLVQGKKITAQQDRFHNPEAIVENNYRVLMTRARKQMVLFIPPDRSLDETYRYFVNMGVDEL